MRGKLIGSSIGWQRTCIACIEYSVGLKSAHQHENTFVCKKRTGEGKGEQRERENNNPRKLCRRGKTGIPCRRVETATGIARNRPSLTAYTWQVLSRLPVHILCLPTTVADV